MKIHFKIKDLSVEVESTLDATWIEFCYDWRLLVFNWFWPPSFWLFEYDFTWYDGPHESLSFGPFGVYWNFGDKGPEHDEHCEFWPKDNESK